MCSFNHTVKGIGLCLIALKYLHVQTVTLSFQLGHPLSAAEMQAASCFLQVLLVSAINKPCSGGIFDFPSLGLLTDVISLKMLMSSLSRPSVVRLNCKSFQFWLRGIAGFHSCRAGWGARPVPVCLGSCNFSHCSGDKILQKPCFQNSI